MEPRRLRVLLVEDDEDDSLLTGELLAEIPDVELSCNWAPSYANGLERLAAGRFDACLVDHFLGAHTGVDFVREAAALPDPPPMILLTGAASREIDLAAMAAGASDFLQKEGLTAALLDRSIRYSIQKQQAASAALELVLERAARSAAEDANRAKDQFLARLSHELRTPLAPILAVATLLEDEPQLSAAGREQLVVLRRNAEQEARLIDDLLDITRIVHGTFELKKEQVEVATLLSEMVENAAGGTPDRSPEVHLALAADDHRVWGDAARLEQAFANLLSNAVRCTPSDGVITVRTSKEPAWLAVEIADTGCGFEPGDAPRLFEAFERGAGAGTGGLGLGLSIVRSIVAAHGGHISALSEGLDRGATFTVRLPRVLMPEAPPGEALSAVERQATVVSTARGEPALHLLLVEDHEDTAFATTALLRRLGHRVTRAAGVRDARAAVVAGERIDLVVSDLWLGEESGLDLMQELAREHGLRGIALSGLGGSEAVERCREAGFSRHLTKPVSYEELASAIREVAAGSPGLISFST